MIINRCKKAYGSCQLENVPLTARDRDGELWSGLARPSDHIASIIVVIGRHGPQTGPRPPVAVNGDDWKALDYQSRDQPLLCNDSRD